MYVNLQKISSVFLRISVPILVVFLCALLPSCSKNNAGITKQVYHDLTGYYNGLFNAELLLDEKINASQQNYQINYSNRLSVYPEGPIVPGQMRCEDVVEKAQAMIQRQNREKMDFEISNQTDDAWLIVGKAFLYEGNFEAAIDAFRYVTTFYEEGVDARSSKKTRKQNSNSKRRKRIRETEKKKFEDLKEGKDIRPKAKLLVHEYARSEALVYMFRAYVESGQYDIAESILTFIRSDLDFLQNLDWEIYRIEADLALKQNDLNRAIQALEKSIDDAPKSSRKTMEFVLGQVYIETGRNLEANLWFTECMRKNGNLEMIFYAKLNQAKASSSEEADRLLAKLLKENKYKEFFGEIWYIRAEFARAASDKVNAVTYYKKACQSVGTPDEVMCRSYTTLGDLYYNQAEYIQASSYYDSASTYANDEINVSGGLQSRRQSLASLAEHLEVIENFKAQEDVKKLSNEELYSLVKAEIEAEDKKLQEAQARQDRLNALTASSSESSGFYFNSNDAINQGRNLFNSIWGERPLEDNWRRSDKLSFTDNEITESLSEEDKLEAKIQERMKSMREASIQSQEDMSAIYEAYYGAGFIFRVNLKELDYAHEHFESLEAMLDADETSYRPNTLYNLYLIAQQRGDSTEQSALKSTFLKDYGKTLYEEMFENKESDEASKTSQLRLAAELYYDSLYTRYIEDSLIGLHRAIEIAGAKYNPNPIPEKFDLLHAMVYAKEANYEEFVQRLTNIVKVYKGSEEGLYAYELLDQLGIAPQQSSSTLPFPTEKYQKENGAFIDERKSDSSPEENKKEEKLKMKIGNESFDVEKGENKIKNSGGKGDK